MIRFNSTRVQKTKCPVMSRLSTASCPPRSGIVINKTVTSCNLCDQLSWAKTIASNQSNQKVPSRLNSNFLGVQKPKCLTMSRQSATSGPPRSGPVINKTVKSYRKFSQLPLAKTKASVLYKKKKPS